MSYNFFDTVAGINFTRGTVPNLVDAITTLASTQKETNDLLLSLTEELKKCKSEIRNLERQIASFR